MPSGHDVEVLSYVMLRTDLESLVNYPTLLAHG